MASENPLGLQAEDDTSDAVIPNQESEALEQSREAHSRYPTAGSRYLVVRENCDYYPALVVTAQDSSSRWRSNPQELPSSLGLDQLDGTLRWAKGYGDGEALEAQRHYRTVLLTEPEIWEESWQPLEALKAWDEKRLSSTMVQHFNQHSGKHLREVKQKARTVDYERIGAENHRMEESRRIASREISHTPKLPQPVPEKSKGESHEEESPKRPDGLEATNEPFPHQTRNTTANEHTKPPKKYVSIRESFRPLRLLLDIKLPEGSRRKFRSIMRSSGNPQWAVPDIAMNSRFSTPIDTMPSSSRFGGRNMIPRNLREDTIECEGGRMLPGARHDDPTDEDYNPQRGAR